jgi:hypothetical protein
LRKRAFSERNEPDVAAACYSSAPHVQFHLFPFLLLYVARAANDCLVGCPKISKTVPCSIGFWNGCPENPAGLFTSIPDCIADALFASSYTRQSRSRLCSSFSAQMTIVHPIPRPSLLGRWHQVPAPLRSVLAAVLLFFIHFMTEVRDTPNVLSIPRKLLLSRIGSQDFFPTFF